MYKFKNKNFFTAVKNSFLGLKYVFSHHRHFKIQIIFAILILILSYFFNLNIFEFLFIILVIFLVLISEIINTLIEEILNFVHPHYNDKIKIIKDISSGMVIVAVIFSLLVGIVVFGNKLFLPIF